MTGTGRARRFLRAVLGALVLGGVIAAVAQAGVWTAFVPDAHVGVCQVTPIDLGTNTAGGPITTGGCVALGVAVTPDGRTAYVVEAGSHSLTPIDVATGNAAAPIDLNSGAVSRGPIWIAISPDGSTAFVPDSANDQLVPVNLGTGARGTPVAVGSHPHGVAVAPDGKTAYVANYDGASVTPITLATGQAGAAIPIGSGTHPDQIAITPDGTTAYVTDNGSTNVYPITLATAHVENPISLGAGHIPIGIAISPDGTTAYTANAGTETTGVANGTTVSPIDLATQTAETAITVGGGPYDVAFAPDGRTAYATNSADGTVTPIDVGTASARAAIPGADEGRSIAITPDQAPVANFAVSSAPVGQRTSFDASASTVTHGTIVSYRWSFGDGTTQTTTTPTTNHIYAAAGSFTAAVTETDSAGTSTAVVFTGQTVSRNGGPSATATRSVVIAATPAAGQPAVSVLDFNLAFGTIAVGHTSAPHTATITNTGNAPLVIGAASLGGTDPAAFAVTQDTCAGATLAPGAGCTAQVSFAPSAPGARAATLAFTDNASGSPHTFQLTGTGTFRVTLSGHVSFQGRGLAGATVQACPSRGATPASCASASSGPAGAYTVTVTAPPGAAYLVSASGPPAVAAGQRVLPPITIPSGDFTGLDISLPALPVLPTGLTVVSPSFGVETAATTNPVVFWNDPTTVQLSRSMFPAGGTVVVTRVVLTGTDISTGAPADKTINVGGTVAGVPVGQVVGSGPVSVTIPPLNPIHGPVSTRIDYQYYPAGVTPPTQLSFTQVLYEVYPQVTGLVAAQPTDPLPAYFVNLGVPGRLTVGGATISGQDAGAFTLVPLTSYGVPPGTTDCGTTPAVLSAFDQTQSTPPPATSCGMAVKFTPTDPAKIEYYARLDVAVRTGGQPSTAHVALIGCNEGLAMSAQQVLGFDPCGSSNGPEEAPTEEPPPPPPLPPDPIIVQFPFVDPSGTVTAHAAHGQTIPLAAATVVLTRGARHGGPFRAVRNRSSVMSPANRRNPDHTTALGHFGWDVLPGFYRVAASHSGCRAPAGRTALTRILTVPPAALGLRLSLRCPHLVRRPTRTRLQLRRLGRHAVVLTAAVRGRRPMGIVVFTVAGRRVGTAAVDPRHGTAQLTVHLGQLTLRRVRAAYSGDARNGPSRGRG